MNQQPLAEGISSKDQLHYLLRDKSIFDIPSTVLENIARIDGAVVLSCRGQPAGLWRHSSSSVHR